MQASLKTKLESLVERHQEVAHLLAESQTMSNQSSFRELSKEYAQLQPVITCFQQSQQNLAAIAATEALLKDTDPEVKLLAKQELDVLHQQQQQLEIELQTLLLPKDPNDERNLYLEIRAGAGGDEAAIFAGDLFRMYSRYAEKQGWQLEIISAHAGEHGGYREIISRIVGKGAYFQLKFESGAHRVQRVPTTEAQGRIHTSTCTVAILAEVEEVDAVDINPAELKVDTYRASGAGGQHVNKTDSAIRITHLPSGLVVECQEERSQHKNRAKAMSLLRARLLDQERTRQQKEQAETRRGLIGTGDRSERIRTYNFPQGRLTDHRINLTLYSLPDIIAGDLSPVIDALLREYQTEQLASLNEDK